MAELFRSLPNDSDAFVFYLYAALQSVTIHKVASAGIVSVYEFHRIYSTDNRLGMYFILWKYVLPVILIYTVQGTTGSSVIVARKQHTPTTGYTVPA